MVSLYPRYSGNTSVTKGTTRAPLNFAKRDTDVSVHAGTPKSGAKTEPVVPWSISAASITGMRARRSLTASLALELRSIIFAPNRPRWRLARAHKRAFDIRVYKAPIGRREE